MVAFFHIPLSLPALPHQCRPLLDLPGVEAGHIVGAVARLLAEWVRRRRTGCSLGMQGRSKRRRHKAGETVPPLIPIEDGHFREVKSGVLLLPGERGETSPAEHSVTRRFLVSCLGDADAIFARLYAAVAELGWGSHTVVVIVGDGAGWIWNRASMFVHRCEILDFWHAGENAGGVSQLRLWGRFGPSRWLGA
jgi:hypothetical protein